MKYTLQVQDAEGTRMGSAISDYLPVIVAFGYGLPPSWKRFVEFAPPEPGEGAIWSWEKTLEIYNQIPASRRAN